MKPSDRVGSGFHNQPEDPILIRDEVGVTKAGVNEEGGDGGVSLVGVQAGSFASFHDGRIVPDSVCTLDTLAKLREEYKILDYITLSLPHWGYDVYTSPQDRLLPLHPTFHRALMALKLAPLQISLGF